MRIIPKYYWAMILIWRNFLRGPRGRGRPTLGFFLFALLALLVTANAFVEGAKLDRQLGTGNLFFWLFGLVAAFAYVFVLPAIIYLIDHPKPKISKDAFFTARTGSANRWIN